MAQSLEVRREVQRRYRELHREKAKARAARQRQENPLPPEYWVWTSLKARCLNPRRKEFHRYGGRGITVCARWLNSFDNFFKDVGLRPSPVHQIERIDNNGNYEPPNCKWATRKEQSNNTRRTHMLTFRGKTQSVQLWSEESGLPYYTLLQRIIKLGWSTEKSLTVAARKFSKSQKS